VAVGSSEELRWKRNESAGMFDLGYKVWGSYIIDGSYKSLKQQ
jgi:hypothetical protein